MKKMAVLFLLLMGSGSLVAADEAIVWKRPDGGIAVTIVHIGTAQAEAERLKAIGNIPPDFEAVAINPSRAMFPTDRTGRKFWKWDGTRIIEDSNVR